MRRLVLVGIAGALCAVAIFAARASSAHAFIPPPGPDPGVAGGGYTLVGPNIEVNRLRFEFALRQSQVDGSIRGKGLTLRAFGAFTCALDAFCGTKFVARSWTPTLYPGFPPPFGGGPSAMIFPCSLYVGVAPPIASGGFKGMMTVFLVDPIGFEHFTGITFGVDVDVFVGPDAGPTGDSIMVAEMFGPLLPFPLPFGPLASGNVGTIEGVLAPSCGLPVV